MSANTPSYMLLNTIKSYTQENRHMVNVVIDRHEALTIIRQLAIGLSDDRERNEFTLMFSGLLFRHVPLGAHVPLLQANTELPHRCSACGGKGLVSG